MICAKNCDSNAYNGQYVDEADMYVLEYVFKQTKIHKSHYLTY